MANVYAANSGWATRPTPKSDIARLEKRALDDGWSEEQRRRASKIMAFPVIAVNEQTRFPIAKKWYANGAWLKKINIEISRVHDPLYMTIWCELSIITLQCLGELSTLAFSLLSAPLTDKLLIFKNTKLMSFWSSANMSKCLRDLSTH